MENAGCLEQSISVNYTLRNFVTDRISGLDQISTTKTLELSLFP